MPSRQALFRSALLQFNMNTKILLIVTIVNSWAAVGFSQANPPTAALSDSAFSVTERGPHHSIFQRAAPQTSGATSPATVNRYVEMATGLNYFEDGQWKESREQIEGYPSGAIARQGQHKVIFASDLATVGAIDVEMADGKRLQSHVLYLGYFDSSTSQSVILGVVTNSTGRIIGSNSVLYEDAFSGLKADVRYTYSKAGLEQDVILKERPTGPEQFGLNPATTQIEVLTEFINFPRPAQGRKAGRGRSVSDETIDFGAMKMGSGRAFSSSQRDLKTTRSVSKQWIRQQGRDFLLEQVDLRLIDNQLQALPPAAATPAAQRVVSTERQFPTPILAAKAKEVKMQAARNSSPTNAFVLDYVLLNADTNDFTFQSDTTYYISGSRFFSGTTTIEGGTVIKISPVDSSLIVIDIGGTLKCETAAYMPAHITSKNDNSIGETISGSTGTPSMYWQGLALADSNPVLKYLKIRYATYGLNSGIYSGTADISNIQLVHCENPIYAEYATLTVRNVLINDATNAFSGNDYVVSAEHFTLDKCALFNTDTYSHADTINLTNSLIVDLGSWGAATVTTNSTAVTTSGTAVFQTVGAGSHYLATNSIYRNVGNTNINPGLKADLAKKTTYPPIVLTGTAVGDTTLSPQAQRDTDVPDLGYHYEPLDYAVDTFIVTNATLVITNGAAIGHAGSAAGVWLQDNGVVISEGGPANLNHLCAYYAVQEQANTNWSGNALASSIFVNPYNFGTPGTLQLNFTSLDGASGYGYHLYHYDSWNLTNVTVRNCRFSAGSVYIHDTSTNRTFRFNNNLFDRVGTTFYGNVTLDLYNSLFRGNGLNLHHLSSGVFTVRDNDFDGVALNQAIGTASTHDHNAYINGTSQLTPTNANDIVLTSLAYQTGALGKYYQPTNSALIDIGSRNATNAGLYHFTVLTNQVKETNTTVDIGFHYVAVDGSGNPLDSDSDGKADYLEDRNGNGSVDSGETDWLDAGDYGLRVFITRPRKNSIIP